MKKVETELTPNELEQAWIYADEILRQIIDYVELNTNQQKPKFSKREEEVCLANNICVNCDSILKKGAENCF